MIHKFHLFFIIVELYFWEKIKCISGCNDFSKKSDLNLNNFTLDFECLIMIGYSMYCNQIPKQIPYKEVCITI